MSNVVQFPRRVVEVSDYIEVCSGTVSASDDPGKIGNFRFFVSAKIDDDDIGIWDGTDYAIARREAEEASRRLQLPIIDLTEEAVA